MYELIFKASVEKDYLIFLKKLSEVTSFYNFSGLNEITTNTNNYLDSSHYNAYVGDIMMDVLCNGSDDNSLYEEGFGWLVTSDNIDKLLTLIDSQLYEEYNDTN